MKTQKLLRPEAKSRLCLGGLAKGICDFKVTTDKNTQNIILNHNGQIGFESKKGVGTTFTIQLDFA